MNSKKKQGRTPVYEDAFKIAIVHEYLNSDLGYGRLGQKHGVPVDTVRFFVKWYRRLFPDHDQSAEMPAQPPLVVAGPPPPPHSDARADKALIRALEQANLKVAALETMISIASKELGVDILKKHGAKQSGK